VNVPAFADLLFEEREALKALMCLLNDEQILLRGTRVDELSELTEKKLNILVRLGELASSRHRTLAAQGYAPDEKGMHAWLDQHPTAGFNQLWTETLTMIPIAKEQNRLNGLLIAKRLSRNQQALSLLRGEPLPAMIYGSDGQLKIASAMRSPVVS
jgi:flagellar biosynthesis/type III secretory pathway chaperone